MNIFRLGLLAFVFVVIQGCGSTATHRETGFLTNYQQLEPSEEFENARVYLAPDFNKEKLAKVDKIFIHPFELWLTEQHLAFLGSQQVAELTGYFHTELVNALSPDYQLVEEMGPNTLGIRGAFTEIKISEPELSPTDFIPFRVVLNAGNLAYLEATGQQDLVTQVGIEVEFTHEQPDKRVLAMTSVKTIDTTVSQGVEGNIQAIKLVLDTWVNNFVKRLAQVRQSS